MANYKVNRYIGLDSTSPSLPRYRKEYLNQHSKFIHASWLLKEDIDREVTLNDIKYTIFGVWDVVNANYTIMLKPVNPGPFYLADSKEVAHALGYSRMRNAVTGIEHATDIIGKRKLVIMPETATTIDDGDDTPRDWDDDATDNYNDIDPIVQALQDNLMDDGDTSNY
jgi:hypothetical protein